eukprot:7578355-Pyramimonas_sp.AAC.1
MARRGAHRGYEKHTPPLPPPPPPPPPSSLPFSGEPSGYRYSSARPETTSRTPASACPSVAASFSQT